MKFFKHTIKTCPSIKQEIAAINLSKFRKAQVDLTETQERADLTEQAYAKYKARGRSASIARDM